MYIWQLFNKYYSTANFKKVYRDIKQKCITDLNAYVFDLSFDACIWMVKFKEKKTALKINALVLKITERVETENKANVTRKISEDT